MNRYTILLPSIYLALFSLAGAVIIWWDRRRRGVNVPFSSDVRLLRGPGERQLKAISKLDEDFLFMVFWAGLTPCIVALMILEGVLRLKGWWVWVGLGVTVALVLAAGVVAVRWFVLKLRERSERYLSYFGTRVVAEYLEPLKAAGWRIFQDVPGESGPERFNVDHIAVGPGGVFAIETLTQRRRPAREGHEDYKVFFDGEQLVWPWGEEQTGLMEGLRYAKWVHQWIEKTTGEKPPVVPVLALPGWTVEAQAKASLRVVNPSWLPDLLTGGGAVVLSANQIEACARQLEQRCRNVDY